MGIAADLSAAYVGEAKASSLTIGAALLKNFSSTAPIPQPTDGHRYWRMRFWNTASGASNPYIDVTAAAFAAVEGGPSVCTKGAAFCSPQNVPAINAFNGGSWNVGGSPMDAYIGWDFGSPQVVREARLRHPNGAYFATITDIEFSDDNVHWYYGWSVQLLSGSGDKVATIGNQPSPTAAYATWACFVQTSPGKQYSSIAEMQLRGVVGGPDLTVVNADGIGTGSAGAGNNTGTFTRGNAFDDRADTRWANNTGLPQTGWIGQAFAQPTAIAELGIGAIGLDPGGYVAENWTGFGLYYLEASTGRWWKWGEWRNMVWDTPLKLFTPNRGAFV